MTKSSATETRFGVGALGGLALGSPCVFERVRFCLTSEDVLVKNSEKPTRSYGASGSCRGCRSRSLLFYEKRAASLGRQDFSPSQGARPRCRLFSETETDFPYGVRCIVSVRASTLMLCNFSTARWIDLVKKYVLALA